MTRLPAADPGARARVRALGLLGAAVAAMLALPATGAATPSMV